MKQTFVDTLPITDVHQEEFRDLLVWKIDIYFTMKNQRFSLVMMDDDDEVLKPWAVYHESDQICPFCQKKELNKICLHLEEHSTAFFRRLIEYPSIRLKWLYLPYEEKRKGSDGKWNPDLSEN